MANEEPDYWYLGSSSNHITGYGLFTLILIFGLLVFVARSEKPKVAGPRDKAPVIQGARPEKRW